MASRKRRHEAGALHGGRLELRDDIRDHIRAYLVYKRRQAVAALEVSRETHGRLQCETSAGRLAYCQQIVSYLDTLLRGGTHTVHPIGWHEAWVQVTVTERHARETRPDHPPIPGME